jgi:hypothetical protein
MRRLRDLVPEYRVGPGFAGKFRDDLGCRTAAQQQHRANRVEAPLQGAQRLRQPPARSTTKRTCARWVLPVVENIKTDHRRAGLAGGLQGGVIGKAEIVAKPDDAWQG